MNTGGFCHLLGFGGERHAYQSFYRDVAVAVAETLRTVREGIAAIDDTVDQPSTETDHRPADALLIRPDAHNAWVATIDEPTDTAALALREALSCWFGTPLKTTVPTIGRPS